MKKGEEDKHKNRAFLTIKTIGNLLLIGLLTVTTCKLIFADISISIDKIAFSDLLSLILALFAMYLSATFYFKATEMSNKFYDNSYTFTKDISEILGRIETGHGEKLSNIGEQMQKYPQMDMQKAETTLEEKETSAEEIKEEKSEIIDEILKQSNLDAKQIKEYKKGLEETDAKLQDATSEIRRLKLRMRLSEPETNSFYSDLSTHLRGSSENIFSEFTVKLPFPMIKDVTYLITNKKPRITKNNAFDVTKSNRRTFNAIQENFSEKIDFFNEETLRLFMTVGVLNRDLTLTRAALKQIINRIKKLLE